TIPTRSYVEAACQIMALSHLNARGSLKVNKLSWIIPGTAAPQCGIPEIIPKINTVPGTIVFPGADETL
ncbi:MAG: hypothetical protein WCP58_07570, partial [bacterium]